MTRSGRSITHLWTAVLEGEQNAWNELVDRYSVLVFSVARRCGLEKEAAEDCLQYVWMMLYRHRKSLKDPEGLPAWLIRTAQRRAIYLIRRERRIVEVNKEAGESSLVEMPDELVEQLETQSLIMTAIARMDGRCRTLLEGLFLKPEQTTYKELATQLGVSINTLGSLRARCLNKLKAILDEMDFDEH